MRVVASKIGNTKDKPYAEAHRQAKRKCLQRRRLRPAFIGRDHRWLDRGDRSSSLKLELVEPLAADLYAPTFPIAI